MTRSKRTEPEQRLPANGHLVLIIAVYLLLTIFYTVFIPPFEGPDEPQHYAYVTWLIRTNSFPPQDEPAGETGIEHESSQHPLYYLLASLPGRLVDIDDPPLVYRPNPNFIGPLDRDYPDNDNRAIHYVGDVQPLAGGRLAFYLARGVTMIFGALLVTGVYGLAHQIAPSRRHFALFSALLVAVTPQVVFLGSVVSNDVPVAALGAMTLWALARLFRRGYNARRAVLLGAVFGLAVLTKASALALAAPIAVGLLLVKKRQGQAAGEFLTMSLVAGATTLLVAGWWFVRGWILYGSPLGLETHDATTWAIVRPEDIELAWRRWWEVFRSFWAWLGWGTLRADYRSYYVMAGLVLLALAGLGLGLWRRRQANREREQPPLDRGALLLAVNGVAVLASALLLELWMRRVIAPFGRLLYPGLAAVVVLLIAGWWSLHRRLPLIPIAFLFLVALLLPGQVLRPAYARPRPLTPQETAALGPSLNLTFGRAPDQAFAELIEVSVQEKSVAAGIPIPVRVCWRTLGAAERDYSVFLQVIGPENRLIAGRRTYPGLGSYPTSQWEAGGVFCDLVKIETRAEPAVEPLVYQVEVGMIDPESNRRVPVFDTEGNQLSVAFVDRVRVYSESLTEPAAQGVAEDGPALQLIDHVVEDREWQAGESHEFVLRWAASTPVSTNYQTFVHLRAAGADEPVAQADGAPLGGWYPTSWWPVNEAIVDRRSFSLPADVPQGTYDLFVGMYALSDGQRGSAEYDLGEIVVSR